MIVNRFFGFVLSLAFLPLALSCQSLVLEDKADCPAHVYLQTVPRLDESVWSNMYFDISMKGGKESKSVVASVNELYKGHLVDIDKGQMTLVGLCGWMTVQGENKLAIPVGTQCPESVGTYANRILRKSDDTFTLPLPLMSLSVNLLIDISGLSENKAYRVMVRGDVDGYNLPDLTIHSGEFVAEAKKDISGKYRVRVPRQADALFTDSGSKAGTTGSLRIELESLDSDAGKWVTVRGWNLSELTPGGYDWTEPILEDVSVLITI